jgi:hypothetical protein
MITLTKKDIIVTIGKIDIFKCPFCKRNDIKISYSYCPHCGKKIKFSGVDDE